MSDFFQNMICISNKNRISGSASKFSCRINPTTKIQKITIEKVIIPHTFYNINSFNNKLVFNDGVDRTVFITPGAYTPSSLIAEMKTKMDADVSTLVFNVVYSDVTRLITIFETSGPTAYGLKFNFDNSIGETLGYGNVDLTGLAAYTASQILNLSINNYYIDIYSKAITRYHKNMLTDDNFNPMLRVANSYTNFGNFLEDENIKDIVFDYDPSATLVEIDIEIRNSQQRLIDFNGVDQFLLYLKIYSAV